MFPKHYNKIGRLICIFTDFYKWSKQSVGLGYDKDYSECYRILHSKIISPQAVNVNRVVGIIFLEVMLF